MCSLQLLGCSLSSFNTDLQHCEAAHFPAVMQATVHRLTEHTEYLLARALRITSVSSGLTLQFAVPFEESQVSAIQTEKAAQLFQLRGQGGRNTVIWKVIENWHRSVQTQMLTAWFGSIS